MFIVVVCLRPPSKWLLHSSKQRQLKLSRRCVVVVFCCVFMVHFFLLAGSDWLAGMCNNTQHGTEAEVHWPVSETMITRAFKTLWCQKLLHCLLHFLLVLQSFAMCVCARVCLRVCVNEFILLLQAYCQWRHSSVELLKTRAQPHWVMLVVNRLHAACCCNSKLQKTSSCNAA